MKLNRRSFALLVAGALSICAADAFGGVPPLPPGAQPHPGMAWCPRCEGRRYVPSGFLGWTSKVCPQCRGTGMVALPHPPPPPVVKPHPHHHPPAPAVHPHPGKPHHNNKPGHGAKPHGGHSAPPHHM